MNHENNLNLNANTKLWFVYVTDITSYEIILTQTESYAFLKTHSYEMIRHHKQSYEIIKYLKKSIEILWNHLTTYTKSYKKQKSC